MCGICGAIAMRDGTSVSRELVDRMTDSIAHRGPDERGVHLTQEVALGHRRLSILDLATGQQPMFNEDGSVCVIFNGEIYNFEELRRELEPKGHVFATRSDTEVIVHLYEEDGVDFAKKLNGDFAIALWDERERRLLLVRDRLGIKPLYYAARPGRLTFGSEIKAILEDPAVERRLDAHALSDYLTFSTILGDRTLFAGVRQLPPGHVLIATRDGYGVRQYWDLTFEREAGRVARRSESEYAEQLRELLRDAVRMRLVADVPLGSFLSGGIDSSSIVALAAQEIDRPLITFAGKFNEGPQFDETPFARMVAERYGTDHRELAVGAADLTALLPKLLWHLDEPRMGPGALPQYQVAQLAAEHVKTCLSGEGGDELFAGYNRFALCHWKQGLFAFGLDRLRRLCRRTAGVTLEHNVTKQVNRRTFGSVARNISFLFKSPEQRHLAQLSNLRPAVVDSLLGAEVRAELSGYFPAQTLLSTLDACGAILPLNRLLYLETKTMLPGLLTIDDKTSMAASLETRPPLLDHRVVEYAAEIPPDLKLRGLTTKYILKEAMRNYLPEAVINKRKMGFPVPTESWFQGPLRAWVREVLLDPRSIARGYTDPRRVEEVVSGDASVDPRLWDRAVWGLLCLEIWSRQFLDSPAKPSGGAR